MMAATAVTTMETTKAVGMTLLSSPIRSILAAAFCNFAGDITDASPPPKPLAAATNNPMAPICSATVRWVLVSMAIEDASDPLIKPPSKPRYGAMTG